MSVTAATETETARGYCVDLHRGKPVFDRANPLPTAREFVATYHLNYNRPTLIYHRDTIYRWGGSYYVLADIAMLRAAVYGMLEESWVARIKIDDEGERHTTYLPFKPKRSDVDLVLDAIKAIVAQDASLNPSCWLDAPDRTDAGEYVACLNGLLHLPTQSLIPHDPSFFALSGLGVGYSDLAPRPASWHGFLADLFGDDQDAKDGLQELFGYLLASDTRFQKVFLIVGPKRSGKGTVARVLSELLGRANVAGPTLNSLGQNFGMQSLIGKPLAVISDARLSGRADQAAIAERLLSVSGEDSLSIPRKHQTDYTGALPTRFLILTNELPRLADASGALASRFIVWNLTRSFYGKEDHDLTAKLIAELPGILHWALEGYRRVYARGRFLQPESGREAIDELEALGSPVGAFVRDDCVIKPGATVECATLYRQWKAWCEREGRDHPGNAATFGRDLRACVAGLTTTQPRDADGGRFRVFNGIRLKDSSEWGQS